MPVITLQLGKISFDKKKELIEKLTSTAAEVTTIPASSFMVLIEEFEFENIGVGGQVFSEKIANKL